jgi:hypothetical protein
VIYDDGTNVGIGTTDPGSYKLNVAGTAAFNNVGVTIDGSSYVNAQRFVDIGSNYYLDPANITTAGLFAGNVGIGTTGPSYRLEVDSDATANPAILVKGYTSGATDQLIWGQASDGTELFKIYNNAGNRAELKLSYLGGGSYYSLIDMNSFAVYGNTDFKLLN